MNFFLGPRNWVVEEVTPEWFKKNVDKDSDINGYCDPETATIFIIKPKRGWKDPKYRDIIIKHEAIHAMLFTLGYYEEKHDELLVDGLAHMWQHYEDSIIIDDEKK